MASLMGHPIRITPEKALRISGTSKTGATAVEEQAGPSTFRTTPTYRGHPVAVSATPDTAAGHAPVRAAGRLGTGLRKLGDVVRSVGVRSAHTPATASKAGDRNAAAELREPIAAAARTGETPGQQEQ